MSLLLLLPHCLSADAGAWAAVPALELEAVEAQALEAALTTGVSWPSAQALAPAQALSPP